jgi:DNA-binding GntR family transcriptional regulator
MNTDVKDGRSVAEQIASTLAERIISGRIAPGERLLQDHLATEFRASHVPVREAFRRLEAQGLVIVEPRRGVRAAPLDPLAVVEVAKMRAALESLALREGAASLTDADLDRLDALIDAESSAQGIEALEALNERFHLALLEHCKMPYLLSSIADLHRMSARHLFATWQKLDWQARSSDEHHRIVDALRAGAVEAACAALAAHIVEAGQALADALRAR